MPRPQTQEEFLTAGYVFLQSMACQTCGDPTEQFRTPDGRLIFMNPMHQLDSKPVLHSTTCKGPKGESNGKAIGRLGEELHSDPREQRNGPEGTERSVRNEGSTGSDVNRGRVLGEQSARNGQHGGAGLPVGRYDADGSWRRAPRAKPLSVEEAQSLAFTPGAWKHVARPVDMPPKEAIWNLHHPWWRWLDQSEPLSKVASLKEAIP
jgi:hypothetical protein